MFKTKLQEFCHKKVWKLPEYTISKQGLDHNPCFEAVVTVNGKQFRSPTNCRSSKQAQNEAAKLAFESFSLPPIPPTIHQPSLDVSSAFESFSLPPIPPIHQPSLDVSSFPQPSFPSPLGDVGTRTDLDSGISASERPKEKLEEANESSKIDNSIEGSSSMSSNLDVKFSSAQSVQPNVQDANQSLMAIDADQSLVVNDANQSLVVKDNDKECSKSAGIGMQHLYKNQLQSVAQRKKVTFPVYICERDGPPHASRFRCKVEFDGRTYENPEYFATLKDAEHAVAKVALMSLCQDGAQEENLCLYKNLLQEMIQKKGLGLPVYTTFQSGEVHAPVFVSNVKVGEETFVGKPSKTKKQAEMSGAKVAYMNLKERQPSKSPLVASPVGQASQVDSSRLQSDVSTDVEMQVRYSPVISNPSMVIEKQAIHEGLESISTRKRGPSPCDDFEHARDISMSSHNVAQLGAPSDSGLVSNLISKLKAGNSSSKRIVICPRQPNMILPDDSTILPMSDDKWVAFSLSKE